MPCNRRLFLTVIMLLIVILQNGAQSPAQEQVSLSEPQQQEQQEQQQQQRKLIDELNQRRDDLPSVFQHDFARNGLPEEFFSAADSHLDSMQQRRDGLFTQMTATDRWTSINLNIKFQLVGDFDVEATFQQLTLAGDEDASVGVAVALKDEQESIPRILRIKEASGQQMLRASVSKLRPDGTRQFGAEERFACEALTGTMRICRRADVLYFLFRENAADAFRLLHQRTLTDAPSTSNAVQLRSLCNGTSSATVVWTNVRVAAEKLFQEPPKDYPRLLTLHVLDVTDGTVKQIGEPQHRMTQLGSPEWSGDGSTIVCDTSEGGVNTSRIVRMNADGTDRRDLAPGCMPSLSPDGTQIVFTKSRHGIMKMNADGSEVMSIEPTGWGTQWSPDGKYIAWASNNEGTNNITVLNVETGERKPLLTDLQQGMVGHIYWNPGWANNSQSIAFKAAAPNGGNPLVVVADLDSPDGFKIVCSSQKSVDADFTWHPDNKRVAFVTTVPGHSHRRIVTVDRTTDDPPQVVPGVPENWNAANCDWSADGRFIVFSAVVPPAPLEWTNR